ncbi:MAG: hypothetical protein IPL95_18940 [Saprospiraceae bacterium]|nr:hypothetical protein [Saprospiraceae bacterium]
MKKNVLFIILLYQTFIINSQTPQHVWDSLISNYERRYNMELTKRDTLLIDEYISKSNSDNSTFFDSILVSNLYSEQFKKVFAIRIIDQNILFNKIIKSLSFNRPFSENNIYSSENNPIYDAIILNEVNISKISNFILKENYLDNCDFLNMKSKLEIRRLSNILKEYLSQVKVNKHTNNKCKNKNLSILKNINPF